jgi:hypothetical protein
MRSVSDHCVSSPKVSYRNVARPCSIRSAAVTDATSCDGACPHAASNAAIAAMDDVVVD